MRLWFGLFVLLAGLGATMAADTIPATGGNIDVDADDARARAD